MKYILNENIRYILNERFILNEAVLEFEDFIKRCKSLLEYIKELLKNAGTASDPETENKKLKIQKTAKQIADKTLDLIRALKNVKDINIARKNFDDYKDATESLIKTIDPNYGNNKSKIFSTFDDISQNLLAETENFSKNKNTLLKKLQEIIPITSELSKKAFTITDSEGNEEFDSAKQEEILKAVYADIYKLTKLSKDKYSTEVKNAFSPIIDLLATRMTNAQADKSKIVNFLMVCQAAESDKQNSLKSIIEDRSELFKDVSDEVSKDLDGEKDWGTRYASASDKAAVWQEYLKAEWKGNASTVDSFGEPFRQECEKLGFTEASNPFITFLKKYLVEKHYPIDRAHYFAIHNAVVHNYLKKMDLVKPSDPITEENNIIFWEDFYLKGNPDSYLELFGSMNDTGFNFESFMKTITDNLPEANQKLFKIIQNWISDNHKTKADFIYLIMSATNSLKDLEAGNEIKNPTSILRPVAELEQLLNALNIEVTKKKAFSDTDIDTLISKIENSGYMKDIQKWAPRIIRRIADAAGSDTMSISRYEKLTGIYNKIKTAEYDWDQGQQILALFSAIAGDVSWDMIDKIAKKFEKKGWLTK